MRAPWRGDSCGHEGSSGAIVVVVGEDWVWKAGEAATWGHKQTAAVTCG